MNGKQIKLFLVDGTPGGLTTAEITNWTGHVLSASRSDLADLLKRDEAQRAGAYMLLGEDEVAVGSTTVKAYASYRSQHEQLLTSGAIAVEAGHGRVTRNIGFSSPSTAGAVALGRSRNGRREWISSEGTFGDWESRGVE